MNSYDVSSYLKDGEDRHIKIEHWLGRLPDENYVEGWIALSVDGQVLLNESHCDLVDQLWAYLIDGTLESLDSGRAFECFFPDQPLKLGIHAMTWDELVFSVGEHSYRTSKSSFVKAIGTGGREFFRQMMSLVPSGIVTWEGYIGKCEILLQRT